MGRLCVPALRVYTKYMLQNSQSEHEEIRLLKLRRGSRYLLGVP